MTQNKEKKNVRTELGMMLALLKIGFIGFGGGSALIPVIEKEVVEERGLVTAEEYNKDVVVASITPGALPMEIATGLGKRAYGVGGMIVSALMLAFPGAFLTIFMMAAMSGLHSGIQTQIELLSIGISAFIACLLTEYSRKTLAEARKESKGRWKRAVVILAGVFLLTCGKSVYGLFGIDGSPVVHLSTLQVLGISMFGILYTRCKFNKQNLTVAGVLIILYIACLSFTLPHASQLILALKVIMVALSLWGLCQNILASGQKRKVSPKRLIQEEIAWILFFVILSVPAVLCGGKVLEFLGQGFISSILSFGGGDAYLSVADGMFVSTGIVEKGDFYGHLVPMVNLLPGSILCKTLSGIGYLLGYEMSSGNIITGCLVALAGFACSVMASGGVFCLVYYVYECFESLDVFRLLSRWIRPIIAGTLLTVMLSLFSQNISTGAKLGLGAPLAMGLTLLIYGMNLVLLYVIKKKNGFLILATLVAALLLGNLALALPL
jgi:chromate transporter